MSASGYSVTQIDQKLIYVFDSKNPKTGKVILKVVAYAMVDKYGVTYYNLGFGDYDEKSDRIDDKKGSDNGDMRKVLRTVVSTLDLFFADHPDKVVHISGSDPIRNEYYQKLVKDYGKQIATKYRVQGCNSGIIEDFRPGQQYEFILIHLKKP